MRDGKFALRDGKCALRDGKCALKEGKDAPEEGKDAFSAGKRSPCGWKTGAGNGNRTRMASLEGWNFTIKLCPLASEGHLTERPVRRKPEGQGRKGYFVNW